MEVLKAEMRSELGRRATRKLRAAGLVPGVVYGHGQENQLFALNAHDLGLVLQHGERVVEMSLDGAIATYFIKAVQRDAFDHNAIHVDFTRVDLDERIEVTVAVVLRGLPAGEADGGVLTPGVMEVTVQCAARDIPEDMRVRVNELKVGDTLRVKDLPAIEGVEIVSDPEGIVASCQLLAEPEEEEAPVAETPAEPEVIGKGKEEAPGESEAE